MSTRAKNPGTQRNFIARCIQKIATGPHLSKDLSCEEAYLAMRGILAQEFDPVQAGIFLIALRMKRESEEENRGVLQALQEVSVRVATSTEEILDIADPYDGFARCLPVTPFLAPLLADCGVPTVIHGGASQAPKFGITHRQVLRAANIEVDLTPRQAADRIEDDQLGWSYLDQSQFCPFLDRLKSLRRLMVKRTCLSTIERLLGPIRGAKRSCFMTGFVHQAYPDVYGNLAQYAGFDRSIIVRGIEGGVIPALNRPTRLFIFGDGDDQEEIKVDPKTLGLFYEDQGLMVPKEFAGLSTEQPNAKSIEIAVKEGTEALQGQTGLMYDSLVFSAALCLWRLKRQPTLGEAADVVRRKLVSGEVFQRFC